MDDAQYTELLALDLAHWVHPLSHPSAHQQPVLVERGEGICVDGADGVRYIDGLAALWNVAVGHGRAELADAAAQQMRTVAFNNNYVGYTNEPAIRLAARLVDLAYDNMAGVYFTNSGSESNETNFKAARFYWHLKGKPRKSKIISRWHSYHGNTFAAMSATGMPPFWTRFEPTVAEVIAAPGEDRGDCPRCPLTPSCNGCIDALTEVIEREGPETVAAIVAEPVQGAGGVYPPADPDYFRQLRALCDRYEILFIADEVITAFGRTGAWFALEHFGVQPDMVTTAKALTSAYIPMGAAIWSEEVHGTITGADPSVKFMHAYTNAGHAAGAAVALRNLQIIEDEGLVQNAAERGRQLLDGLRALEEMPHVGNARGLGLMCGIELFEDADSGTRFDPAAGMGAKLAQAAQRRGLISRFRFDSYVLAPPLVISAAQIDDILSILRESIQEVTADL